MALVFHLPPTARTATSLCRSCHSHRTFRFDQLQLEPKITICGEDNIHTYTHTNPYTRRFQLVSDFNQTFRSFDFGLVCEGSYSVCLLLCASHSGKEKFYELVIVVVALVEHDTPFVCAINIFLLFLLLFPRRCLGQLLIGSSKFHCLAFKLQLFAVKMVINIDRESEWERVYLLSAMQRLTHGQSMRGGGWYKRNREWKPVYVFGSWHNETPGRLCRKLASALMISRRGSRKYMTRKRI